VKTLKLALLFVVLAFVALASSTAAKSPPPGNDGNHCHGANQIVCRPDPQPSHGQDCRPHGKNTDGNDDHCASTAPSVAPSDQPSTAPSDPPSIAPSSAPSDPPATASQPGADSGGSNDATPPPTDTIIDAALSPDGSNALVILGVAVLAFVLLARLIKPKRS
jgi:hypothetical protein